MAKFDFTVSYQLKDFFFDRLRVQNALQKAESKNLSRIGAFIRTTARRRVLRRRKRVSSPGEAPSVHSKDPVRTLKNILFGLEPSTSSVIVGPVKLNQVNRVGDSVQPVPQILEFGGTVSIHEEQYRNSKSKKWFRRDLRRALSPDKNYRTRTARYLPRPFMAKALDIEVKAGTIKDAWRATLNRAA